MRRTLGVGLLLVALGMSVPAAAADNVDIQDNQFVPATLTVHVGDTVVWTDTGSNPHSVTADDGSFDSSPAGCGGGIIPATTGCLRKGQTFSHTFNGAGTFTYRCKIHGAAGMLGAITVTEVPTTARATTTTRRAATTTTTRVAASTTTATVTPGDAVTFDTSTSSTIDGTAAAKPKHGSGGGGSHAVAFIVAALAAVALGGGALLWRLRPTR